MLFWIIYTKYVSMDEMTVRLYSLFYIYLYNEMVYNYITMILIEFSVVVFIRLRSKVVMSCRWSVVQRGCRRQEKTVERTVICLTMYFYQDGRQKFITLWLRARISNRLCSCFNVIRHQKCVIYSTNNNGIKRNKD